MEENMPVISQQEQPTQKGITEHGMCIYMFVKASLVNQKKMSFPPTTKLSPRFGLALIGRCMLRVVVRCTEEQGLLNKKHPYDIFILFFELISGHTRKFV